MKNVRLVIISFLSVLFSIQTGYGQIDKSGTYEGIFMDNFKTLLSFDADGSSGSLKMYSGETMIQDDALTQIEFNGLVCKFFIPDKNTSFDGSFSEDGSTLSGNFIFPDGAKHALQVKKVVVETVTAATFTAIREKKFSVQQIRDDFTLLYTKLKETHPKLYAYNTQDAVESLYTNLLNSIKTPATLEDAHFLASQLTDAVKCSHTGVRLPQDYQSLVDRFGSFFPLQLYFTEGKAYYIPDASTSTEPIPPGAEIVSINQKSMTEIIDRLKLYIPTEGHTVTTEYYMLNKAFHNYFYFADSSPQFNITHKAQDELKNTTIKAIPLNEITASEHTPKKLDTVSFEYTPNNTLGWLTVPSFEIRNMDSYFKQLDSIFSDLQAQKTPYLALDLRGNKGGHPIFAAQLLSYLTAKEFTYFKRNDAVKDFEPLYNTMPPNKKHFKGQLFIVVDGGCLSTTGHLISLLRYHTQAVFIGQQPGSTFQCNDFSTQVVLPYTGLEVNIPKTTFTTAVSGFSIEQPFKPNYEVVTTVVEQLTKKDKTITIINQYIQDNEAKEKKGNPR